MNRYLSCMLAVVVATSCLSQDYDPCDGTESGIDMGLLPNSPTIVLTPSDPVPSPLLMELQNACVGHFRKGFTRTFWPVVTIDTTGSTINSTTGAIAREIGGTGNLFFDIPCDEGDRLIDVSLEIFGDGASDANLNVFYSASMATHTTTGTRIGHLVNTNTAAAWTLTTLRNGNGDVGTTVDPTIMTIGGSFVFVVTPTSFSTLYAFGVVRARFDRLP